VLGVLCCWCCVCL